MERDDVVLKPKPVAITRTVAIGRCEYIVKGITDNEVKKLAAYKHREAVPEDANLPIAFLKSIARVRRHIDKREKYHFSGTPSILEEERKRREAMTYVDEKEVSSDMPDDRSLVRRHT